MRLLLSYLLVILLISTCTFKKETDLSQLKWIHGSANCSQNRDKPIQIVKYNATTWIMRQNKCVNYEAPFMYLFLGDEKALLVDTGATTDSASFPLRKAVDSLIAGYEKETSTKLKLIVAHSHSHGDHYAADVQFRKRVNTDVVSLRPQQMKQYFRLHSWPQQTASLNLGKRPLTLIPIPGHDEVSIAFYDSITHLLLTGDSFYPGRLYVRDWLSFKESIIRLNVFCKSHRVDYILGNHIEMKDSAGLDYPTGTTYQPNEAKLPLTAGDLQQLTTYLQNSDTVLVRKVFDKFIIETVHAMEELEIDKVAKHTVILQGYPDFLACDGDDVWITNSDKVQKLSRSSSQPVLQALVPGNCGAPEIAFGSLWVANCKTKSVVRVNTTTGKIMATIATGVAEPNGELSLAASDDAIWVLSDEKGVISKIDPITNTVIAKVDVKSNSYCATFGFGSVWITNTNDASVQRIDPKTNAVIATIAVSHTPRFLAAGEGAVWTLNQSDGSVSMIDPSNNKVIETIATHVPGTGGDIAAGNGRIWVRAKNRMLQSIDPLTAKINQIYVPVNGSGAVRVAGKQIWVSAHDVNKVWVLEQ